MTHGVLLMAYGSPERPDEVEPYYTHIRGGRVPSAESVRRLQDRYDTVGGRTPLLDITNSVREALEQRLNALPDAPEHRVYVGMKHWHPFIGDVFERIAADGVDELTAVALAPHYSRMSIGGYRRAVDTAITRTGWQGVLRMPDSWHLHPGYVDLIATRIRETLAQWPPELAEQVVVVFSAHSLPARIRQWDDPYERQLLESCRAVAERVAIDNWRFAWQSAGETGEAWLGPDISELLEHLRDEGVRHVLSVPFGFVTDHLEILYDLDHVARRRAESLALTWRRTPMPNADPEFVDTLASVVTGASRGQVVAP